MQHQLSKRPRAPPPTQANAPDRHQSALPLPHHDSLSNEPVDWPLRSVPDSSTAALQRQPRSVPASALLAARTTPPDSLHCHTPRAAHFPAAALALLPPHSTAARPTPAARPALPTRSAPARNGPTTAP